MPSAAATRWTPMRFFSRRSRWSVPNIPGAGPVTLKRR